MEEPQGDINIAAALRAQYAIQTPKPSRRRHVKKALPLTTPHSTTAAAAASDDEEEDTAPLVDTTASLDLHSKKTNRLQKRNLQKTHRAEMKAATTTTLFNLPTELLLNVITCLQPSSIFRLSRTSRSLQGFISANAEAIAKDVIKYRYSILAHCFPLPFPFESVPEDVREVLLSPKRQEMMGIHRKTYYQHIPLYDPKEICTCMTCVFAWNNLCLVLDLNHWQQHLERREPIPMIARGTNPLWNQELLQRNATLVRRAMMEPLLYTAILEAHLSTITTTILRSARWKRKGDTKPRPRLYDISNAEAASGADGFLERDGPPSYDFPFHRDNYYALDASYVPNRKWSRETGRWHYYQGNGIQHERDLEWVKASVTRAAVVGVEEKKQ